MSTQKKEFKHTSGQRQLFINRKVEELIKIKCVEKELLEAGLEEEREFISKYTGVDPQRSERRLGPLYNNIGEILKATGFTNVTTKRTVVGYLGNDYSKFNALCQVTVDVTANKPFLPPSATFGFDAKVYRREIQKNIHNHVRMLIGEAEAYNYIVEKNSGVKGNYFTSLVFLDSNNSYFDKAVNHLLSVYEMGYNICLIPYEYREENSVEVFMGAVPAPVQIMNVLRGI